MIAAALQRISLLDEQLIFNIAAIITQHDFYGFQVRVHFSTSPLTLPPPQEDQSDLNVEKSTRLREIKKQLS